MAPKLFVILVLLVLQTGNIFSQGITLLYRGIDGLPFDVRKTGFKKAIASLFICCIFPGG